MKTVIRKMQETAAESGLWERLRREGWNITEELESIGICDFIAESNRTTFTF